MHIFSSNYNVLPFVIIVLSELSEEITQVKSIEVKLSGLICCPETKVAALLIERVRFETENSENCLWRPIK